MLKRYSTSARWIIIQKYIHRMYKNISLNLNMCYLIWITYSLRNLYPEDKICIFPFKKNMPIKNEGKKMPKNRKIREHGKRRKKSTVAFLSAHMHYKWQFTYLTMQQENETESTLFYIICMYRQWNRQYTSRNA